MPNSATLSSLVETAAKWSPTAPSHSARDPCARAVRVGHRLLRRERFRRDDEQRARRIEAAQRVGDIGAIDVGDEMAAQIGRRVRRQRPRRHRGSEIRAADADVDHIGHRLAQRAAHPALAHVAGEGQHPGALRGDVGHDVAPVDHHRLARQIAQGGVKHGAPLGRIDDRAGKHRVALGLHMRGARQTGQRGDRRRRHALARIVEQQIIENDGHRRESPGVGGEFLRDRSAQNVGAVLGERRQNRRCGCLNHWLPLCRASL